MWSFSAGSWAKSDLDEYRAGYPDKRDNPRLDKNIQFYRNATPLMPERKLIEEVHKEWFGDYRFLEYCHSYIQWLFPIQEAGLNPAAQVLQKHEIEVMKNDPEICARVVTSFRLMLDFYGFTLAEDRTVVALENPAAQFRNLNTSSHNYLRITRILKFLGEMGMEDLKLAWLRALEHEIFETKGLPNCGSSFDNYWSMTIYDNNMRAEFAARAKQRPAPPPRAW